MRHLGLVLAFAAIGGPVAAHSFDTGADAYNQVIEGASVMLTGPGILLPILALGVFLSLWNPDGLPRVWLYYLLGHVAGVGAAALVGPWVTTVLIGLGVAVGSLAAVLPSTGGVLAAGLAGVMGLGVLAVGLEGHGLFELSVFIHIGLFLGANIAIALPAAATRFALDRVPAPWMRIAWRVVASWIAAILTLYLAFELSGGLS